MKVDPEFLKAGVDALERHLSDRSPVPGHYRRRPGDLKYSGVPTARTVQQQVHAGDGQAGEFEVRP